MKVKLFYILIVLALASTVSMIVFGFEAHRQKSRAQNAQAYAKKIEETAMRIAAHRAKIKAQKKKYGNKEDVLTATTIEKVSKRNGVSIESAPPITDIDQKEYIEKGYAVKIRNAAKMQIAKFMADLEEAIPGAKIKSLNLSRLPNDPSLLNVQFIIVKSFPKLQ